MFILMNRVELMIFPLGVEQNELVSRENNERLIKFTSDLQLDGFPLLLFFCFLGNTYEFEFRSSTGSSGSYSFTSNLKSVGNPHKGIMGYECGI